VNRALLTLASCCVLGAAPALAQGTPPNIILILADDFGVDYVQSYAEGIAPPCTPNIDGLASAGMLFRNAWTNPVCSPTRAAVMTGRQGFRTGVGDPLPNNAPGLALAETTLPEMLTGYASAASGKWHLHGNLGNSHPNDSGFDTYAGSIRGAVSDYFSWAKITNGASSNSTTYAVSETVDDALAAMATMPEPWFTYVSFNSIHTPFHVPPSSLCPSAGACPTGYCGNLPGNPSNPDLAKAMAEAMDMEIGRLLASVDSADTYVFFLGDNGTPGQASEAPFLGTHAKGSMYEGGVNVPFIVTGPGVVVGESPALVGSVDLFATFAELAGVGATADDSVSLVPCLSDVSASVRTTLYTERFDSHPASYPAPDHQQAIRDGQYKLIRRQGAGVTEEFYDLFASPFETANLLPGLTAPQQAAYDMLASELDALLGTTPTVGVNYCTAGTSANGCQALLSATGTPSASLSSGFELHATGVEGNKRGIFFIGTNGRQQNAWGSGTSLQCVVPSVQRTGTLSQIGTNGACDGAFSQDLNATWCSTCPKPGVNPGPGTLVQAQLWYRDPQNTSNQTTSLSDALEFSVLP
jgi:arylsulfatase B